MSRILNLFNLSADNSNPTIGCDALRQRDRINIGSEEDNINLAKTEDKELTFQHMSGYPLD